MHLDPICQSHCPTGLPALFALVALLAACGGGGDSPAAPALTPTAGGAAPAPAPPAPGGGTVSTTGTCNLPDFATSVLARVNQYRAAGANCGSGGNFAAAPALAWNLLLTAAADAHSRDMVANNFFSHTGANGSNAGQRITAAGYVWSTYGENIAAGQSSINQVVDGWMASAGHCANIMHAAFADIGVVCVAGNAATTYSSYWTMDLGKAR
jgi:uncharacterized protein YkwD